MTNPRVAMPLPHVAAIPPYNAGVPLSSFERVYGVPCRAKLDSNENPLGPGSKAIKAAQQAVLAGHRYPDSSAAALKSEIAAQLGTTADKVQVGNGSEELIYLIYHAVLAEGHRVVTVVPSFGLHDLGGILCKGQVEKIPFTDDWSFPVEELIQAARTEPRIMIISSPSNPVGSALDDAGFGRLLKAVSPDTLIVLDEAYVEFMPQERRNTRLKMLQETRLNWVSLRTFSKAYGLAGFRVGYAICADRTLAAAIKNAGTPFNVNLVALEAARAALDDSEHLERSVELAVAERERMKTAMRSIGLDVADSQSNALFFDAGQDATQLSERLRAQGILFKAWKEEGYENCARVSVGLPEENDAFLTALAGELRGKGARK